MKNYRIYKKYGKDKIETGDILRIDLFDGYKMKDVPELDKFTFIYSQKGYNDNIRKTRYIKVFN